MKYKDLIQFESLDEVVKFNRLGESEYRQNMVSSYVFSKTYEESIIPEICKNLDYTTDSETFGLQIVGTYGTGKSHLMSLFSLIAEDENYLQYVRSERASEEFKRIAGKYKVVRFELGSVDELWNLVCYQIDKNFKEWGIDYSISKDREPDMYKDKLNRMMAQFEEAYPNKGLMIVIDEMLSYLKGRSGADSLNRDLAVLQAYGEMSDHSKFRMVFGVQELIYQVPEFQFSAKMLNQVNHRYRQIEITKQDVQFVTEKRILKKTEVQKNEIRKHLEKFTMYFTDMHANLDEYINLFPVNPSFFDNFQQIRIGKSQREILKTLSRKFEKIADYDVPDTRPGLICYDSYWDDLQTAQMQTFADIRRITEIMQIINQKIDENFTGARENKKPLAHKIANACAIKILQASLEKTNGATVETLVDDLCYVEANCLNRDFLIDIIGTTAKQIVSITVGQYFEQNKTNQEYHLRIEGGVNYEQKIKDYVSTMSASAKDSYFYNFLVEFLPIDVEQYRREFKIYPHHVEWKTHKVMLDGYIFFGNPSERSTTHPEQYFYIYFMPIFDKSRIELGDEQDSVYFCLDKVSDEMKQLLEYYAACESLLGSADSSQKNIYQKFLDMYKEQLKAIFDKDFKACTEVYYMGEKKNVTPAMMSGNSNEEIVNNIASTLLEDYFCQKLKDYPKFTLLRTTLTSDNRATILNSARQKIAYPTQPNRDGDAILAGLGLLQENQLSTEGSIYAIKIKLLLDKKGDGQVVNRDEILYRYYKDWNDDWRSIDFHLQSDLEFIVLSAMVAMGEIEIELSDGNSINAANLMEIVDLPREMYYGFTHIRKPQNMNVAAVRELFIGITGKDMSARLNDRDIYVQLCTEAKTLAQKAVQTKIVIENGLEINGIKLIADDKVQSMRILLSALAGLCDQIQNYNTPAKMRNLKQEWTADVLRSKFKAKNFILQVENFQKSVELLRPLLNYLEQAKMYMVDEDMKNRTEDELENVKNINMSDPTDMMFIAYKNGLEKLINEYAEWYLKEYKRMHLTPFQDDDKRRLMNSDIRTICKNVCDADRDTGYFSVATQYREWERQMNQLKPCDINVSPKYLKEHPYAGFNPIDFQGEHLPEMSKMREELETIHDNILTAMQNILSDTSLQEKTVLLEPYQLKLLERFNSKEISLTPQNAELLVGIVIKLHSQLKKIPVSSTDLRNKALNRPMSPQEAVKAFSNYIKDVTEGTDADNVRITFNN